VAFADHDDVWMPAKLTRLEGALAANPRAEFVFSDGWLIDAEGLRMSGSLLSSVGFGPDDRRRFASGGALEVLLKYNVVTGAAMAVRRTALTRILPFEPGWVHDYYIALALSILGQGVLLDEPLIQYRRHASQQIGVAGSNVRAILALARRQDADHYRQQADNFDRLRARLLGPGAGPGTPGPGRPGGEGIVHAAAGGDARAPAERAGGHVARLAPGRLRPLWSGMEAGPAGPDHLGPVSGARETPRTLTDQAGTMSN
jgi:hypothetical protein